MSEFRVFRLLILMILGFLSVWPVNSASAQTQQPQGPIYIVQAGDTLWDIAQRFGVSWEDLANENDLTDPTKLSAGDELIIPGLQGIQGVLTTESVLLGENLTSISRHYHIPEATLVKLNHITSRDQLYLGSNVVVPMQQSREGGDLRLSLAENESLLELATANLINPWQLVNNNSVSDPTTVIPGDVLVFSESNAPSGPGALPNPIDTIELNPISIKQGDTAVIRLRSDDDLSLQGMLMDKTLNFFQGGEGEFIALQGIHAMVAPGLYPLQVTGKFADGRPFGFTQKISVASGDFIYETLQVPAETLDPANTKPEDEMWQALVQKVTPEKLWNGIFQSPITEPSPCGYTDFFGNRRSYNGSPYNYFHTGLDFCYNYNLDENKVYAPADGIVVFAGPLIVRGNSTMIDHGLGVYSGYMHQAEIFVKPGDRVKAGQEIGMVGETGRVNGPHLHLEIWVNGVQVNPLDWLEHQFP